MSIDSAREPDVESGDLSNLAIGQGWGQVAFAVNSLLQLDAPMFMKIVVDSHEPLYIDFRHRAFVWATSMSDFPATAQTIGFETELSSREAPPLFKLPGENLDSLLWVLGNAAYDGVAAPWLKPNERYRLAQWPNLTKHLHDMRQMHMLAVLGNAYFSVPELAAAAGAQESAAHDLINALSLMRLLRTSEEVAALSPEPVVEATKSGLFSRLRARLGR